MKRAIAVTILILLMFAAGCGQAKKVKVTYKSSPPGGTLYKQDGEVWGQCPMVLWYDLDKDATESGYIDAKGLVVRWPNGQETRSDELIRITVDGRKRQVLFTQPRIAPSVAQTSSD